MRLLDRYLLRELLIPLGFCLSGFLILWIAADLVTHFDEFQEDKLRVMDMAEYYLVKSPEFLAIVLPLALLLALLYALTNHARHHEISAMRAAGVSLWRLALPYFVVGLLGSLALFYLNEYCAPDSEERAERIRNRYKTGGETQSERGLVRNLGFTNAREGRSWLIGIYNLETSAMTNLQVEYAGADGSRRLLSAARGIYTNDTWLFFNVGHLDDTPHTLWLVPGRETNLLAMPQFTETPEQIRSEVNISRRMDLRRARKADIPLPQILDYLRLHPQLKQADHTWLHTKLHGRLAAPWTCLVVVLIAIPFGAASGRRNVFFGVAGSVFICFAYFVLLQLGLALGTGGYLPPWFAAWSPNLFFGIAGAWLTARVR